LRRVRGIGITAAVMACGLVLAGCGDPPAEEEEGGSSEEAFQACMVTDTGGVDDRSFNASSWAGMQAAAEEGDNIEVDYVASENEQDYEPNLSEYAEQECGLIVAVGGLMADALTVVAEQNPDQQFAIVDALVDLPNVYSMQFNTAQSSFLAGYLAAGMSQTGVVATYGGMNIPPVTIFMDGFVQGVEHYNQTQNASVRVLGWDVASQNGTFAESFTDATQGQAITETFVGQGADVIFPVAGGAGIGTATVAQESNGSLSVIWVDIDGCVSLADYCDVFLTSVVKNISDAVRDAVLAAAEGEEGGSYIGTLENNGTFLANYRSDVPQELQDQIAQLQEQIIAGEIEITSPSQP